MMRKILIKVYLKIIWVLRSIVSTIYSNTIYVLDLVGYSNLKGERFKIDLMDLYPCIYDKTKNTGFDRHYIYFPAWALRTIIKYSPRRHVDISSSLAFCSMASAIIPVDFYDYRPAHLSLHGLSSGKADITSLPFTDNAIQSISSMHVIEHIGLGRYGDALDHSGDIKAAKELKRVLAVGGSLLVVLPIGRNRVQFNAHRIYSYQEVMKLFKGLKLRESYIIPDGESDPVYNPSASFINSQNYGCGCFWFVKE